MTTWPTDLPDPLLNPNAGSVGGNVARTDMESGPARQRLRFGDNPDELSIGWKFKPAEMQIFIDFWRDEINQGTDWFLMDLHRGEGLLTYEVRFIGGAYQDQPLSGLNWLVTAKLDVRKI